tara:strand:+ start:409 stop:834 length:426 start_codon:yes stop_codon:yes gene_type:complete
MNEVPISAEDQKTVSEMYENFQRRNQEAHDLARLQISQENQISEEEAEIHPDMEGRFELLRTQNGQQGSILSVNPDTGEPGSPTPRIASARPPTPPVGAPPIVPPLNDAAMVENVVRSQGFNVLQVASDYTQGIITLVISR